MKRGVPLAALTILAVAMAVGCSDGSSPESAHLKGKITLNGADLPPGSRGSVIFRTVGQGQMTSAAITNGSYESPETPRGPVKVFFTIEAPTGKTIQSDRSPEPYEETVSIVPEKYATGIDLEVTGDNSAQNFDLTD